MSLLLIPIGSAAGGGGAIAHHIIPRSNHNPVGAITDRPFSNPFHKSCVRTPNQSPPGKLPPSRFAIHLPPEGGFFRPNHKPNSTTSAKFTQTARFCTLSPGDQCSASEACSVPYKNAPTPATYTLSVGFAASSPRGRAKGNCKPKHESQTIASHNPKAPSDEGQIKG